MHAVVMPAAAPLHAARASAPPCRASRFARHAAPRGRRAGVVAAAGSSNGGAPQLTLHLGECTVAFPFTLARAQARALGGHTPATRGISAAASPQRVTAEKRG
jgi:hypothetical protein